MSKVLLILLTALLILPNFFDVNLFSTPKYNNKEKFNSGLSYINSIKKLENYTDSIAIQNNSAITSFDYVLILSTAVKYRFYHGFSHFSLSENWLAALTGKLIKDDHACNVEPENIMMHSYAACSQQEIIMMAVLKRKKVPYRPVLFPHHYAIEAFVENKWFYFDPDMEPEISKEQRMENSWKNKFDNLKQYYDTSIFKDLEYDFGKSIIAVKGSVNEAPAPNALIFQQVTGVLSKSLWCIPFLIIIRKKYLKKYTVTI